MEPISDSAEPAVVQVAPKKCPSDPKKFFKRLYESDEVNSEEKPSNKVIDCNSDSCSSEEEEEEKGENIEQKGNVHGLVHSGFEIWPGINTNEKNALATNSYWNPLADLQWRLLQQQWIQKVNSLPPAFNNYLARKKRRDGRARRQRTTFSNHQTLALEVEFQRSEYISRGRRCELAQGLGLSETQVKIWFQNRRAKDKRLEKAHLDQQVRCLASTMGLVVGTTSSDNNEVAAPIAENNNTNNVSHNIESFNSATSGPCLDHSYLPSVLGTTGSPYNRIIPMSRLEESATYSTTSNIGRISSSGSREGEMRICRKSQGFIMKRDEIFSAGDIRRNICIDHEPIRREESV